MQCSAGNHRTAAGRWLFAGIFLAAGVPAAAAEWSSGAAITSDYVFRGVSQTVEPAALQAWLALERESGLYASVWVSNVDLVPAEARDDGARVEADFTVGYAMGLGRQWSLDVAAVHYAFPGTDSGVDYDYMEWIGSLTWRESIRVTAGYSDSVFGEPAAGWYAEAGAAFALPGAAGVDARLVAGHYDLAAALGQSYRYWQIGVGRDFGPVRASVDWHGTSDSADQIFYRQTTGSRAVLTLEWALR